MSNKNDVINNEKNYIILGHTQYTRYESFQDYETVLFFIKNKVPPDTFEYLHGNDSVNSRVMPYFDIDSKNNAEAVAALNHIERKIRELFYKYEIECCIKESHGEQMIKNEFIRKYSYHIIFRLKKGDKYYFIKSPGDMKTLYNYLGLFEFIGKNGKKIIDDSVYRGGGGFLRTIYGVKPGNSKRPFVPSKKIDGLNFDFNSDCPDLHYFVKYPYNENYEILEIKNVIPTLKTFDILNNGPIKEEVKNPKEKKVDDEEILELEQEKRLSLDSDSFKERHVKQEILEKIGLRVLKNNTLTKFFNYRKLNDDSYSISYHGFCIYTEDLHSSNHPYIVISMKYIYMKCFNDICRKISPKKYNSEDYIEKYEFNKLFGDCTNNELKNNIKSPELKERLEKAIKTLINNEDNGVNELFEHENGYQAEVTNNISTKYKSIDPKLHYITPNEYLIKGSVITAKVDNYELSPVYKIYNKYYIQNNFTTNYNYCKETKEKYTIEDIEKTLNFLNANSNTLEYIKDWLITNQSQKSFSNIYIGEVGRKIIYVDKESYFYHSNKWEKDPEGMMGINDIINVLSKIFREVLNYTKHEQLQKVFLDALEKIGTENYVKSIYKLARGDDPIFYKTISLDSNWDIIPFNNGIYDLKTNTFREHRSEDFITKTTGYDYDPNIYNIEVENFLKDITMCDKEYDYLVKYLASLIKPGVLNDILGIFIGEGANGKTGLLNLISRSLGPLSGPVPPTLFTRNDAESQLARPDLIAIKDLRIGYLTEPDGFKFNFNGSIVKRLCGEERITCRGLYKEQTDFWARTKFLIGCNQLPEIGSDKALWRRIKLIKFNRRFVEKITDPLDPTQKLRNLEIMEKIKTDNTWRQTFMNILIKNINEEIPPLPESWIIYQEKMKDTSLAFKNFLEENIVKDPNNILTMKKILTCYYNSLGEPSPPVNSKEYKKLLGDVKEVILNMSTKDGGRSEYKVHRLTKRRETGWKGYNIIDFDESDS